MMLFVQKKHKSLWKMKFDITTYLLTCIILIQKLGVRKCSSCCTGGSHLHRDGSPHGQVVELGEL